MRTGIRSGHCGSFPRAGQHPSRQAVSLHALRSSLLSPALLWQLTEMKPELDTDGVDLTDPSSQLALLPGSCWQALLQDAHALPNDQKQRQLPASANGGFDE